MRWARRHRAKRAAKSAIDRTSATGRLPALVVGVDDTAASREAVGAAAFRAVREGAVLHLVAVYRVRDGWSRGFGRDRARVATARRHAERQAHEAGLRVAQLAADLGVVTLEHVRRGSLRSGVRKVSRAVGAVPVRRVGKPSLAARLWSRASL